ncbi:multicopy suppressor of BFA (Brefeldin A) [Diplodia seriata]
MQTCKFNIEADAEGLIRYFDPSDLPVKETNGTSKFAAQAGRPTDDSAFKGMKVVKKKEEDYFAGSGSGKKGKLKPSLSNAALYLRDLYQPLSSPHETIQPPLSVRT